MKHLPKNLRRQSRRLAPLMLFAIGVGLVTAPEAIASNRIIQAEGGVLIKRRGWSEFRVAEVGSVLHPGDLVQPTRGATVVVLCENSNRWRVPAGVPSGVSNGCPAQRSVGLVSSLRGDADSDRLGTLTSQIESQIPYIVSPRRSWVLEAQPRLRWTPVSGAAYYTVRVVGPGVDWSTQVTDSSTRFDGDTILLPGETYLVIVETDTGASSQQEIMGDLQTQLQSDERDLALIVDDVVDGTPVFGLGFSVLPSEEATILAQERDRILALRLPPEAEALTLADFYTRFRLMADAIEVLSAVAQSPTTSAAVHQALGNLYQHVGLLQEAEVAYRQAIALSTQAGDAELLVLAHVTLARLYAGTGRPQLADSLLTTALPSYEPMESSQRKLEFTRSIGEVYALLNQQAIADRWLNQALSGYQQLLDLAQTEPPSPNTAEIDSLTQQVEEIEYLLSTLEQT